jgi:hypothetical protein
VMDWAWARAWATIVASTIMSRAFHVCVLPRAQPQLQGLRATTDSKAQRPTPKYALNTQMTGASVRQRTEADGGA